MNKLAFFLILSLGLAAVGKIQAQDDVYVFSNASECARSELVDEIVQRGYEEQPLSQSKILLKSAKNGRLYEGILVIYMNLETRDHTLVVHFKDGYSCVLGTGTDFAPANAKSGTSL